MLLYPKRQKTTMEEAAVRHQGAHGGTVISFVLRVKIGKVKKHNNSSKRKFATTSNPI